MECAAVESVLSALVDGELEDAAEVESHLVACAACRRKRALLTSVRDAVRALPEETVSDRFGDAFRKRLDLQRRTRARRRRPRSLVLTGALAAALILGLWASSHLRSRPAPISAPFGDAMSPESRPGLDCGLGAPDPWSLDRRPCSSAGDCGLAEPAPAALTPAWRADPVCVTRVRPG